MTTPNPATERDYEAQVALLRSQQMQQDLLQAQLRARQASAVRPNFEALLNLKGAAVKACEFLGSDYDLKLIQSIIQGIHPQAQELWNTIYDRRLGAQQYRALIVAVPPVGETRKPGLRQVGHAAVAAACVKYREQSDGQVNPDDFLGYAIAESIRLYETRVAMESHISSRPNPPKPDDRRYDVISWAAQLALKVYMIPGEQKSLADSSIPQPVSSTASESETSPVLEAGRDGRVHSSDSRAPRV